MHCDGTSWDYHFRTELFTIKLYGVIIFVTRKKSFQSKLPTEVTVCYKPYCVYIFAKKSLAVISHIGCTYLPKKAFEARLRDGRRSSATPPKNSKQNKTRQPKKEERLRGATFVRSSAKPEIL